MAIAMKLMAVINATSHGGRCEMNLLTYTATPIFSMNARAMPHMIGTVLYRVARTPVVYSSLSPTISATNTVPYVARIIGSIGPESPFPCVTRGKRKRSEEHTSELQSLRHL